MFNLFIKMKKVVLFFAVCASVALASCGGNSNDQATSQDTVSVDTVATDTVAADTVASDSAAADTVASDSAK